MTEPYNENLEEMDQAIVDLLADEALAAKTMDPSEKERILRGLKRTLGLPPEGGPDGGAAGGENAEHAASNGGDLAKKITIPLAALAMAAAVLIGMSGIFAPQTSEARRHEAVAIALSDTTETVADTSRHLGGAVDPSHELVTPTSAVENLPNGGATEAEPPRRIAPASAARLSRPEPRDSLAEEKALIASLRNALAADRFDDASRFLREHEAVFADGQLVAERETLRVWLLEDTGQKEAANARAKHFHQTYPNSVLRSAVERRAK